MKTKRILSLLAAAAMAVTALTSAMTVSAVEPDEGKIGENLTWTLDENGKLTISGDGEMASPADLKVNAEPSDYSNIYTYRKEHMEDITAVEIKEGVTSIGFAAFYKMPNLETVILPTSISKFESAPRATTAVPDYEGYNFAFAECTSLKNLTLPEGIKAIGAYSFSGCTALESVEIPSSIKEWGYYSFSGCSKLKDITLSDGLTLLGGSAFRETAVESIVIPASITTWNNVVYRDREYDISSINTCYTFANCKKLKSVTFMDGLTIIGGGIFADCSSLKKVKIPKSVTSMKYAFAYCTGLQEAYIEEGAMMPATNYSDSGIDSAFSYCTNLKRLEIPAGVNASYNNPRYITGCSALTDIYLHCKDYTLYMPDGGGTPKFHCYFDSTTYNTLKTKNSLSEDRLSNLTDEIPAYYDLVKTRLDEAKAYDENLYTPESYGVLKALIEKAGKFGEDSNIMEMEEAASDIRTAIRGLEKKTDEPSSSDPTQQSSDDKSNPSDNSSDPSNNPTKPSNTEPTTAKPATKAPTTPIATTNGKAVKAAKDKENAEKVMKQAKITKLTAKAKGKKKIVVSWKKVKNAKGYEVQVATNKKFKNNKIIVTKNVKGKKVTIKCNKIKSKKTYYVRIRAYTTYQDANGVTQKVYSSWIKKIRKVKAK